MNVVKFPLIGEHKRPRPRPPETMFDLSEVNRGFVPALDLATWVRAVFIDDEGPLANPAHAHLQDADIGVLWTTVANRRHGLVILGQAEMGDTIGGMGKWAKARARQQLCEWFGDIPTFVMTISADYARECEDIEFCALIEHELFHMGQDNDEFGSPKFKRDGKPAFGMRGHDVEEFVGVVRRYGAEATGTAALVEAANKGPEIGSARITQACGTCLERRVA